MTKLKVTINATKKHLTKDKLTVLAKIFIWTISNGKCQRCFKTVNVFHELTQLGHRKQFAEFEDNSTENLGVECKTCNTPNAIDLPKRNKVENELSEEQVINAFINGFIYDALFNTDYMTVIGDNKLNNRTAFRMTNTLQPYFDKAKNSWKNFLTDEENEIVALNEKIKKLKSRFE